jgi:hypothetical protein
VLEDRLEQALLQSVDNSASLAATLCAALAGAAAAGSGSGGASHPEFDRDREFFENERKASIQARGLDSSSLETALVRAQELCSRLSAMAGHAGSDLRWTAAAELAGGALRALLRLAHPPGPNSAPGGR